MKTLLLGYRDHTHPRGGGAVHGHHVVEQLQRLGFSLITLERHSDHRLERLPRTLLGMRAALARAQGIYLRCDAHVFDSLLLALNRRFYHRPVVLEVNAVPEEALARGSTPRARAALQTRRTLYRTLGGYADAVVCVSRALGEYVARDWGFPAARLFVVPNGGSPAEAPPKARRDPELRLVWAGSLWPWQALDRVIEASRQLFERHPQVRLYVFTDTAKQRFSPHPAVRISGPLPQPALLEKLREMDVGLCLYRTLPESPVGFYHSPLKLFDFMASGLPVVASALGQICEVVEHRQCGLLVGETVEETVRALDELCRNPGLRNQLGASALARIRARYTWNHTGDGLGRALRAAGV